MVIAALGTLALTAAGCSSNSADTPYGDRASDNAATADGRAGVSDEDNKTLDDLYAAAKDGGQSSVNLYSAYAPTDPNTGIGIALKKFEDTFPGITVKSTLISGAELISRTDGETASGNNQGDLVLSGPSDIGYLADNNYLDAFEPVTARDVDSEYSHPDGLYTIPFQSLFGIVYNTDAVTADEVPDSLDDLLDPEWNDRVTFAQPNGFGPSDFSITTLVEAEAIDEDDLQRISDAIPVDNRSASAPDAVTAVAEGRYDLALWGPSQVAATQATLGAPISVGSIPDLQVLNGPGLGLLKNAPSPDAAKLLETWLFTPTAQKLIAEGSFNYGTVPGTPTPPGFPEVGDYDLPTIPAGEFSEKISALRPETERIFGPAI
ncbi:ABC transporter substrate-binding protein [Corynebacterium provencense]|uniref:ABC transporter substrate-binding protein n=1 Tax=Corynebacterium provencense TaxID=1737425 RepID=UPI0013A61060|nr:extracellular solute-binding protein [Corynebacterium provencense]